MHTPMTASQQIPPAVVKKYELEEFSSFSKKNVQTCRKSCLEEFEKDMPAERLNGLLQVYSQQLIEQKAIGYNCTGLTTLRYPVRVRAKLGKRGLGNVADLMQVISHEEVCF